jgi:hypothetical protein
MSEGMALTMQKTPLQPEQLLYNYNSQRRKKGGGQQGDPPEALRIPLAKPTLDWTTIFIGSVYASTTICHVFCVVKPK